MYSKYIPVISQIMHGDPDDHDDPDDDRDDHNGSYLVIKVIFIMERI